MKFFKLTRFQLHNILQPLSRMYMYTSTLHHHRDSAYKTSFRNSGTLRSRCISSPNAHRNQIHKGYLYPQYMYFYKAVYSQIQDE